MISGLIFSILLVLTAAIVIDRQGRFRHNIGIKPLVLLFSKTGDLMRRVDGVESKAPKTIEVRQWQEVHFVHNSAHAEFNIDRAAANDLFLQYQGTVQQGEDTIEKYEVFNYGTTFYLHVDVETLNGKKHKAIPFKVEADTP